MTRRMIDRSKNLRLDGSLIYRLDPHGTRNIEEIDVRMVGDSRNMEDRQRRASEILSVLVNSQRWEQAHHAEVERARLLKRRPDMPTDRIAAYDLVVKQADEIEKLKGNLQIVTELYEGIERAAFDLHDKLMPEKPIDRHNDSVRDALRHIEQHTATEISEDPDAKARRLADIMDSCVRAAMPAAMQLVLPVKQWVNFVREGDASHEPAHYRLEGWIEAQLAGSQPLPSLPVGEIVEWKGADAVKGITRTVDFRFSRFDVAPGTKLYAENQTAALPTLLTENIGYALDYVGGECRKSEVDGCCHEHGLQPAEDCFVKHLRKFVPDWKPEGGE